MAADICSLAHVLTDHGSLHEQRCNANFDIGHSRVSTFLGNSCDLRNTECALLLLLVSAVLLGNYCDGGESAAFDYCCDGSLLTQREV